MKRECVTAEGKLKKGFSKTAVRKRLIEIRQTETGKDLKAYQCGTCGLWHIGHKRPGDA